MHFWCVRCVKLSEALRAVSVEIKCVLGRCRAEQEAVEYFSSCFIFTANPKH